MDKRLKVGVRAGAGPAPGYAWNVLVADLAYQDAMQFLEEHHYAHLAEQVRELARENDPTHSQFLDVRAIEDFYELREKHGPLGNMNVRVFFCLDKDQRAIVILGTIKKQNDGATHVADKIRMRRRMRMYFSGGYGKAPLGE